MTRWLCAMVVVSACGAPDVDIVVEWQGAKLAQATDSGWKQGDALLIAVPGTFTFPQAVAFRFKLVDDETAEMPMPKPSTEGYMMGVAATNNIQVTVEPACSADICTAEISVLGLSQNMFEVGATEAEAGVESKCFFYAVFEDANPEGAAAGYRAQLDTQKQDCIRALIASE